MASELVLNIDHLAEILDLLNKLRYSGINYYELGLHLGLSSRTLDIIAKENGGDVNSCLRRCLKAWLERADDVKRNGDPTYYSLIQAMRKIEQNSVADGIEKEKHPCCGILARFKSDPSVHDLMPKVVLFLHKENIIGEIMLPATAEVLMNAVEESVCADHHNLKKFAAILRKSSSTVSVGNAIDDEYRKKYESANMLELEGGGSKLVIHMPLSLNDKFVDMRIKFGHTFCKVLEIMTRPTAPSVDKLKNLLKFSYSADFKTRLTQCSDVSSILELIQEKCSLVNVRLLESVMSELEVHEAVSVIQKYKDSIEAFFNLVSLRLCLTEMFSSSQPLKCETATICVGGKVDTYTLNDVKELISLAINRLSISVTLIVIREDNSFTITCSFPLALSESFITAALENIDILMKKGLQKLTIGYCTVYDHKVIQGTVSKTSSEWKQQLYSSVCSSQGTMEQLLVSQSMQLHNSEEELAYKPIPEGTCLNELDDQLHRKNQKRKKEKSTHDSSTSGYLVLVILLSAVLSGFIISLCELSKYSIERDSLRAKLERSKQDEYVKIEKLVEELAMHKHKSDHLNEDRNRCLRTEEELREYMDDLRICCNEARAKFDQCKKDKRELDHQYQKLQIEVNKLNMEIVPLSVNHVPYSMHYAMYAHKNGDNRKRREATV